MAKGFGGTKNGNAGAGNKSQLSTDVKSYLKFGELKETIASKDVVSSYNDYSDDRIWDIEYKGLSGYDEIDQVRVRVTPNADGYHSIELPSRSSHVDIAKGVLDKLSKMGIKKFELWMTASSPFSQKAMAERLGFTQYKIERITADYGITYRLIKK